MCIKLSTRLAIEQTGWNIEYFLSFNIFEVEGINPILNRYQVNRREKLAVANT